ncbi:MAG: polysaccharide biosynthesis tyrosine autokinase [Cyanothece sp. SIO1E1]|nr:polysaccharide biosynthesis tyrosine autokinase [Cyanothece sp. SIO1E1]
MENRSFTPATLNGNGHNNGNGNGHSHNGNIKYPPQFIAMQSPRLFEAQDNDGDLRQFLTLLRRRAVTIISVATAVIAAVSVSTLTQTPEYEGKFQILVEPVTAQNDLAGLAPASAPQFLLRQPTLDYNTQIQVLRSPELIAPILTQLQAEYPSIDYDALINHLTIRQLQDTKILEVRYRNANPEKIQFVLEHLAQAYLSYSLDERQTNVRQGIQFVEERLPILQQRVDQLQDALQAFREQYNFVDPETRAQELAGQANALAEKRIEADTQLTQVQSRWQNLQGEDGVIAMLNSAPVYQDLVGELRQVEIRIARESTRFQDLNPAMQVLHEEQQNLLPVLDLEAQRVLNIAMAEVGIEMSTLENQRRNIAIAAAQIQRQIQQLPALTRRYTDFQRELRVATESLNRFLATHETLQVKAAQTELPWQLLAAPAQPQTPIASSTPRSLLMGVIAGILLGVGAAVLIEKLDNVFHSIDELKEKSKLPLLGMIPFHKQFQLTGQQTPAQAMTNALSCDIAGLLPSGKHSGYYGTSSFLESFRSLHANIRFLSSDTPVQSLTISSALPGDGKSTVALHLATAAAAMGQRVLLVDADLRRPQVHERLGLPNLQGLSNLISTNLELPQVIQTSPSDENLYVITAGQIPPDPTKLLSSRKMQCLVEKFQQDFDLVIYDTPPLAGLADSSLLAHYTNGLIIVASLDKTDRAALLQTLDNLKTSLNPVLGLVANGCKNQGVSSGYYYYHHKNVESVT